MFKGNEVPTEKQYDFALEISKELEIDLPRVFTREAYSDFINLYKDDYNLSLQSYHLEEGDEDYY